MSTRRRGGGLTARSLIEALGAHYGRIDLPPARGLFQLVVWENIAYMASPKRRAEAFALLKDRVGLEPADLATAGSQALEAVAAHGILKETTVGKLRECARIAREDFHDVESLLALPAEQATRALTRFPGVGKPGAQKILLFAGKLASVAPDSNGVRVIVRTGLIAEAPSYAGTWESANDLLAGLGLTVERSQQAHLVLWAHGRTLCRRAAPHCRECPVADGCAYGRRALRRPDPTAPRPA